MSVVDFVIGWVAIGLAAAYMAWVLPFRRGVTGLTLNTIVALVGAVGVPLLALAIGALRTARSAGGFAYSAIGALAALGLAHAAWELSTREARRANR